MTKPRFPTRADGRPLRPLTPIFDVKKRYGAIEVGGTPPGSLACTPTLSLWGQVEDSNNFDASGGIAVDGDYAYVTTPNGANDFQIVDVSGPTSPTVVGVLSDFRLAFGTAVVKDGNYCYVGSTDFDYITVVDVSNPASPSVAGAVSDSGTTLSSPDGIAKNGDYLFVAGFYFTVIDVSTPASPSIVTNIASATSNNHMDVVYDSGYCYVTKDIADSVIVIDVSTPGSPSIVGTVTNATTLNRAWKLTKDGDFLYVTTDTSDYLTVIDVSTPASPTIVGSLSDTYLQTCRGIAKNGDYCYVASYARDCVTLVDVSNPASMSVVEHLTDPTNDGLFYLNAIAKAGRALYAPGFWFNVVDTNCP